jgi:hypothetical protein
MAYLAFHLTNGCCGLFPEASTERGKAGASNVALAAALCIDLLLISAVVFCILGKLSILSIPPAAYITLGCVGSLTAGIWIGLIVISEGRMLTKVKSEMLAFLPQK